MIVEPVTLAGRFARLEPLEHAHAPELLPDALEPSLWQWTTVRIVTAADLDTYIAEALRSRDAGAALPFLIRDQATGAAAGCTRFGNISVVDQRVEIGWTWLLPRFQRTAVNTEAKYMLLRHAFERWGCNRVELRTDALNVRSRAAISRIGAIEEGTLRQHMVTSTGRVRDTVCFGITRDDWPAVRERLEQRLDAPPAARHLPS